MRKFLVATSAAAILAVSSLAALAADATGAIASIDTSAMTVTLADGKTYKLPASTDAASLQVGQQVKVTFDEAADGTLSATAIEPAS